MYPVEIKLGGLSEPLLRPVDLVEVSVLDADRVTKCVAFTVDFVLDELHLWIAIPVLVVVIIVIAVKRPPTASDSPVMMGLSYGQLLIPGVLFGVLSSLGAGHEGGWCDSTARLAVSASLVFGPVLVGAVLTFVCSGRRWITALIGACSSLLGQVFLYVFMLIGT